MDTLGFFITMINDAFLSTLHLYLSFRLMKNIYLGQVILDDFFCAVFFNPHVWAKLERTRLKSVTLKRMQQILPDLNTYDSGRKSWIIPYFESVPMWTKICRALTKSSTNQLCRKNSMQHPSSWKTIRCWWKLVANFIHRTHCTVLIILIFY